MGGRDLGGEILLLLGLRSPADSLSPFPPLRRGGRGGGTGTAGYLAWRLRRCWRALRRYDLPRPASHPPLPPLRKGGKGMVRTLETIVRNKSRSLRNSRMTRSTPTFHHPSLALPRSDPSGQPLDSLYAKWRMQTGRIRDTTHLPPLVGTFPICVHLWLSRFSVAPTVCSRVTPRRTPRGPDRQPCRGAQGLTRIIAAIMRGIANLLASHPVLRPADLGAAGGAAHELSQAAADGCGAEPHVDGVEESDGFGELRGCPARGRRGAPPGRRGSSGHRQRGRASPRVPAGGRRGRPRPGASGLRPGGNASARRPRPGPPGPGGSASTSG